MEQQACKTKKNIIFKLFSKHSSFLVLPKSPWNKDKNNKKPKIIVNNKHPSDDDRSDQEPTSPKIPCIGGLQLLLQKKKMKKKSSKKLNSKIYGRVRPVQRLDGGVTMNGRKTYFVDRAPNSTVEVRRLASRHETFKKFDRRVCYEDFEKDEEEEEEEEVVVDVCSIDLGGGDVSLEPRKEVNLWKRRTKPPPPPLQLN